MRDWVAWHEGYDDPGSEIAQRLPVVQSHIEECVRAHAGGNLRLIGFCSGSGGDVLPILAEHGEGLHVRARLVELDGELAERARRGAAQLGLEEVDVVTGDAGRSDTFDGATPADLVLVCGVLGNISDGDVRRTIRSLPQFCAHAATVVWTRHRREPDLTPAIRRWLGEAGFAETRFDSPGLGSYAVGSHVFRGEPQPLRPGTQLFTFVR